MSMITDPPAASRKPPTSSSAELISTPTVGQRWSRWRNVVLIGAVIVLAAVVIGLIQSTQSRGYLDPDGVDAQGARAIVHLLEDEGVAVEPVRSLDDALETEADATLFVAVPDLLTPSQISRLTDTGADIVAIAPNTTMSALSPSLNEASGAESGVRPPSCQLPAAEAAGKARLGGTVFQTSGSATGCYPVGGSPSLVSTTTPAGGDLVVLGTGEPLTNEHLDADGNAALAMNVLGTNAQLTWYRPTLESGTGADRSVTDLLPGWVAPVALQLAIAAILAALWRARRFGPLVAEPLPVVVHAAEVTEGRARLYRRGRSRAHAAETLRGASLRRLHVRLGIPTGASADSVDAIVSAVATRTGRPDADVHAVLAGPEPTDDTALVQLADDLDELERLVG